MATWVCLIAPPGGGKGTQGRFLVEQGFQLCVMSGLINSHHAGDTHSDKLVDDETVIRLLSKYLDGVAKSQNLAIDGFPRNVRQVEYILNVAKLRCARLVFMILDVFDEDCRVRVEKRRNLAGKDARPEDDSEIHGKRLKTYNENLALMTPYITAYARDSFEMVDGNLSIEEVRDRIFEALALKQEV